MKVVCCKNCGAKYQLDDNEDISTYECSSCSGELELLEDYSTHSEQHNPAGLAPSADYSNTIIVQCEDCGLKYKINSDENILDYECESCGGFLRYTTKELNEELNEYIKDRQSQQIYASEPVIFQRESEEEVAQSNLYNGLLGSIKDFPERFDTFFSESAMEELAREEELANKAKYELESKTARTSIPESILSKFEKEFDTPKTDDYTILKDYLKSEFYKSMDIYYLDESKDSLKKINSKNPMNKDSEKDGLITKIKNIELSDVLIVIGALIFIGGTIEVFVINTGVGIAAVIIGGIILCTGLIKSKDEEKTEHRSRIIREHLLALPEEYYVFYNVRVPDASSGINHLVVGPTGIYGILSQKYNPKVKLESENENLSLINSKESPQLEQYDAGGGARFRYTTTKVRFEQDAKIKHKALDLGENLINFLNDNQIRYCFVEPLVGFVNNQVVVINMPLTDENLFIDELINKIKNGTTKLDQDTIDKCAVLISKYSADCSAEF
ncbi:MAG: NERD domain-containing protein [archaeon]|nr:NERD domain-containing protein [archaeon]